MSKHTPGPWETDDENQICAANRVIARVQYNNSDHEWDANARLIAATPELLAALEKAMVVLRGEEMTKQGLIEALTAGLAAIKKAKSE